METIEISKALIEYIGSFVKLTDVTRRDYYYLFDLGKDAVTHFRIKNRRWLFGIWITNDEDGARKIDLFGEHLDRLDKFKPSYTNISTRFVLTPEDEKMIESSLPVEGVRALAGIHPEIVDFVTILEAISMRPVRQYMEVYDLSFKEFVKDRWFYLVTDKIKEFAEGPLNALICKAIVFWVNLTHKKDFVAEYHDRRGIYFYPKFELDFRHYTDDNDLVFDRYNKWFGRKPSIGFYQSIRVEHFEKDAKRSFYYKEKTDDEN